MIHGDLKGVCFNNQSCSSILSSFPAKANILIDKTGHARLADFGLVTIISDPTNLLSSSSYTQAGTVRWTSPELIDPQRFGLEESRRTKSSDCYALGMVMYETISGHFPFHRHGDYTVIVKILAGEHPHRGGGFSENVWKLLELCWATQPDQRPSAKDVLQRLDGVSNSFEQLSPEMETDSCDQDSPDDSSGMFPLPAQALQCFAISVPPTVVTDPPVTNDVDLYMSSLHSRTPLKLSDLAYPTDNLHAVKQIDDPGPPTNDNFVSGAHIPQIPPRPLPLPPPRSLPQIGFRQIRDASELRPITTRPRAGRRTDENGIYLNVRALASTSSAFG